MMYFPILEYVRKALLFVQEFLSYDSPKPTQRVRYKLWQIIMVIAAMSGPVAAIAIHTIYGQEVANRIVVSVIPLFVVLVWYQYKGYKKWKKAQGK